MKYITILAIIACITAAGFVLISQQNPADFSVSVVRHPLANIGPEAQPAVAGAQDTTEEAPVALGQTVTSLVAEPMNVDAASSGFLPANVTVAVGSAVTWHNRTGSVVRVAPGTLENPTKYSGLWEDVGAGTLQTDGSYTFIFSVPGVYVYFDANMPTHTGAITVTE